MIMRTILSIIGMTCGLWLTAACLSHDELTAACLGLLIVFASSYIFSGTKLGKQFIEEDDEEND